MYVCLCVYNVCMCYDVALVLEWILSPNEYGQRSNVAPFKKKQSWIGDYECHGGIISLCIYTHIYIHTQTHIHTYTRTYFYTYKHSYK